VRITEANYVEFDVEFDRERTRRRLCASSLTERDKRRITADCFADAIDRIRGDEPGTARRLSTALAPLVTFERAGYVTAREYERIRKRIERRASDSGTD
jgi:hypothetical protein